MNSFNRLSYTYRYIFNRNILFNNNRRCSKFCVLKKYLYLQYRKKTIKTYNYGKTNQKPQGKKIQDKRCS